MALVIPPGFGEVSLPLQHEQLARQAFITYGVDLSAVGGDFAGAADAQVHYFVDAWDSELDSQVVVGPAIIRVGQDGGPPLSVVGSDTGAGTETAAMPPPSVSLLVKKATNLGGRIGRGRVFIPWALQEAGINDVGNVDGSSLSARQADADGWLGALAAGAAPDPATPMVLLHDDAGAGASEDPTPVVGLTCSSLVANQRRRLGR